MRMLIRSWLKIKALLLRLTYRETCELGLTKVPEWQLGFWKRLQSSIMRVFCGRDIYGRDTFPLVSAETGLQRHTRSRAGSERTRGPVPGTRTLTLDLGVLLICHNQQGIRCSHQPQQCPNTFENIKMIASIYWALSVPGTGLMLHLSCIILILLWWLVSFGYQFGQATVPSYLIKD